MEYSFPRFHHRSRSTFDSSLPVRLASTNKSVTASDCEWAVLHRPSSCRCLAGELLCKRRAATASVVKCLRLTEVFRRRQETSIWAEGTLVGRFARLAFYSRVARVHVGSHSHRRYFQREKRVLNSSSRVWPRSAALSSGVAYDFVPTGEGKPITDKATERRSTESDSRAKNEAQAIWSGSVAVVAQAPPRAPGPGQTDRRICSHGESPRYSG